MANLANTAREICNCGVRKRVLHFYRCACSIACCRVSPNRFSHMYSTPISGFRARAESGRERSASGPVGCSTRAFQPYLEVWLKTYTTPRVSSSVCARHITPQTPHAQAPLCCLWLCAVCACELATRDGHRAVGARPRMCRNMQGSSLHDWIWLGSPALASLCGFVSRFSKVGRLSYRISIG